MSVVLTQESFLCSAEGLFLRGQERIFPAQGIFKVPLRFDGKPGSEYPNPRRAFHKPCQDFLIMRTRILRQHFF